ncbi:Electron transport complex protein RnfC [hydrothermal vent metagenome]|uniref:Electron transport complex protein RnfC n=1 Tax=hydrothermal vent metagenome TaxID=652676 RepID=A0A3B0XD08_9ZZZZ
MSPIAQLAHFHGGLKLQSHKTLSTASPVVKARLPEQLILPLQQHIGIAAKPLVNIGDHVLKGQMLAEACGEISAPIHAPTSGEIVDINEYPAPHPSGLNALCIVLNSDGKDTWCERHPLKPSPDGRHYTESPAELRQRVYQAGIVGLGGATFPTSVKLNPGEQAHIDTLILNGAECEPYISCDDMLMREYGEEVISGCELIQYIVSARQCLIAIEDNKPRAIEALRTALKKNPSGTIDVVAIPTIYPTGGEKQLVKVVTQQEIPSDGLPSDIGVLVQNVATAVAVHNAIHLGEPLISRIVSVTGEGIRQPQNMLVLVGTPMSELIAQSAGYHEQASKLIMGGPMMGFCLPTDELPVTRACNCLLVENTPEQTPATLPCIRCGACSQVCPAQLLPQQLFWHASSKNFDMVQDYHLFDCIECGCCTYVCPSQIPLVQYYRFAKTEIWNQERERIRSDHARIRHDFRQARLAREKKEREEKLRLKKELLEKKKQMESTAENSGEAEANPRKAAIEAAMKRVQEKKAMQSASQSATPSPQKQQP